MITYNDLEKKVLSYTPFDVRKLRKAYNYASNYHKDQLRASGEPYIIHPLNIAYILTCMNADMDTVIAGMLHDVVEDTESTLDEIESIFNKTIRDLVDGVTKMTKFDFSSSKELSASNLRKIIVSLIKDPRIIIIKLVDRLHNMRTLEYKSLEKQQKKAVETLEIYVPLAYYIGASKIKDELENTSFKYLKPSLYGDINKQREELKDNTKIKDYIYPYYEKVKDMDDVTKKMYIDMNFWLPNDILLKADKMSMANSLELRVPFLDKEVFEYARKIPTKYLIKGKLTKYIFRDLANKNIPNDWAKRRKLGFPVPFSIWIREDKYYNMVKSMFNENFVSKFFDKEVINKLLEDHYNNKMNNGRKIYNIYIFLIWYKKYFVELK